MKPFLPATLWALLIFALSVMPGIQMPETIVAPDKLGHLVVYGILNWLILNALRKSERFSEKTILLAFIGVSTYGILLEFVQWAFFPNRFFEVWDMIANIMGALTSIFLFKYIHH